MRKNSTWELMASKQPVHKEGTFSAQPSQSTPGPAIDPAGTGDVKLFKKPLYVDHVLNHALNFRPIRKIQFGGSEEK